MTALAGQLCLVTGASGFLGSWLVERLVSDGARVRCLVRQTSRREFLPLDRVELAAGDVTDPRSLQTAVSGVDVVFHLAGRIKARDPSDFYRVNYLGTIALLEACRQAAQPPRVVYVSSLAAVGPSPKDRPLDEDHEPRPVSPYGRSKLQGELAARSFAASLPLTIVRPPAIYGPRDRETLAIFRLAAAGIRPVLAPEGAISLIHAADLADGLVLAATHPAAVGRTYFLAGDEAPSPAALIALVGDAVGRPGVTFPVPAWSMRAAGRCAEALRGVLGLDLIFDRWKAEEALIGRWACSNVRARHELGFAPRVPLASGLRETARWYRKVGWL